jgi:eukaryotic-like serine/threonine-protein kinase
MTLRAGFRIGPYEVVGPVGAGGMGEVYRARDTTLGREVALKILPDTFADDPDRRQRFEREARTLAALNHPHIAQIYGVEGVDGARALVMELVDGETLAERIARGRLPFDEATPFARQIAEALEAAHEQGIVHRDLKPGNVKIRPDGTVKVLDFGLAKGWSAAPNGSGGAGSQQADAANSPTVLGSATQAGMILGTAAYMAPEQARGKAVDKRADIWAFGVVLFEMLTGRRLFEGETISDTLAAVLTRTPDWTALPATTTPAVRRLLERCLDRDPKQRLRDIGEARVALSDGALSSAARLAEAPPPSRSIRWAVIGAAALALAIVAGYALGRRNIAPGMGTPALLTSFTQLTDRPGVERQPTISPDGRTVVYVSDERGSDDLYLLRVGGRNVVPLTADSEASDSAPAFSPDGTRIAFRSERDGGGIFVMDATGESVRRLTGFGFDPRWSPDGTALVVADEPVFDPMSRVGDSAMWVVTLADGQRRKIAQGDAVGGSWSPSGRRVVYWARDRKSAIRDIWSVASDGSQATTPVPITSDVAVDWSPAWAPDGRHVYFASNRGGPMNLWRVPVDEVSGQALGPPQPVTTPTAWAGGIQFSADGRHLVFAEQDERASIQMVQFDPVTGTATGQPRRILQGRAINSLDLSSDGKVVVFSQRGQPWEALGIVRADGTGWSRLTEDHVYHRLPTWSPDGRRVLFYMTNSIRTLSADGSGLTEIVLPKGDDATFYPVWSPDGRHIVAAGTARIEIIDPSTMPATVVRELNTRSDAEGMLPFSWSPDGRWIAGTARWQGSTRDRVRIIDAGLTAIRALMSDARSPAWLPDSRRLLVARPGHLAVVDATTGTERQVLPAEQSGLTWGRTIDLSSDGRTLAYLESQGDGDIWLMTVK